MGCVLRCGPLDHVHGKHEAYDDTTCFVYRTAIGIKVKDGIILAVEKIITSKLLVPGANKRIATIDTHAGLVRRFPLFVASSLRTRLTDLYRRCTGYDRTGCRW